MRQIPDVSAERPKRHLHQRALSPEGLLGQSAPAGIIPMFNLQCWALTGESFFDVAEWIWLYNRFGYTGDYEFIYFE